MKSINQIILKEEDFVLAVPIHSAAKKAPSETVDLTARRLRDLERAHEEMKIIMGSALDQTVEKGIPMTETVIIFPQILEDTEWVSYLGFTQKEFTYEKLANWWTHEKTQTVKFSINAKGAKNGGLNGSGKWVVIDFWEDQNPKHDFFVRC